MYVNTWWSQAYYCCCLLCSWRRHDASTEKLANRSKSISASLQRILKHVVPICRVLLGFPERTNVVICRSTLWAFRLRTVCLIKAVLMKRVLAQKMHRR